MASKLNLTKLETLGPMLGELVSDSSNPQPQRPPAPACRSRESGKFGGRAVEPADESEVCRTLRHRAKVVAYPGLRLKMGRSFHN